jgi:radical SAM protein
MHHPATTLAHPGPAPKASLAGSRFPGYVYDHAPRNVYWETTIACDLACQHCRANAIPNRDPLELTFEEGKALLDEIKVLGSMVILTGGDPMKRDDLFELIRYARSIKVPVSITPSTTSTVTSEAVHKFKELGVAAMGVSLDGPTAELHDAFRGVSGTFVHSMNTLDYAREARLPVQINTTVTSGTIGHLPEMYEFLRDRASPPVRRWSLFLLVPVGRGLALGMPTAEQIEELFEWAYDTSQEAPFHIATVEAPHYRRYHIQRKLAEGMSEEEIGGVAKRLSFGMRDGNGVIFVSHQGNVYPAGFLPHPLLGNVRDKSLSDIYRNSPELAKLRDMDALQGKCGECEYRWSCGRSRARAFATTGSPMESDPFCAYQPGTQHA